MNEIAIGQLRPMQQAGVKASTWTRTAAAVGVASIVISTIGYILHGDYPMGKGGVEIVKWATTTSQSTFVAGIYVEIIGYLLFLLFAGWLWAVTREAEGASGWISTSAFVGAVLLVGIAALDNGLWIALLDGARQGTNTQTLRTLRDGAEQIFAISFLFEALFMLLVGYLIVSTRVLPRWIGIPAIVIGVGLFVPPVAVIASLLFELWVLVVSIYLLVRPSAVAGVDRGMANVA